MKNRILLVLAIVCLLVCAFAISVSAAPQNYQSYEVELVNGEKITVYQAQDWDPWQGRIWLTDTMYTEAPVDSDGTYATVDWSQIKVLDFTNAWGYVYNSSTGEHELKIGTNNGGSMHIAKTNFTPANATSLVKIKTGVATLINGTSLSGLTALEEVVIDSSLKEIGYNAFDGDTALTTITVSGENNIKNIGQQAFIRCTALETVDFIPNVTSMGTYIFGDCTALKTVEWPSAMTSIPASTFNGCIALEFEIPSYVTAIKESAFKNCDALASVTIPDGATELGSYAFSSCNNLEKIIISESSQISNKLIGVAEYCPKLKSFRIPPLVTELGYDNFRGCTSLAEIIWPNNLLKISGGQNFSNIAITKMTIPNSVTYMEGSNFTNLEEINFGASMTNLGGGNLMSKNLKRVYIPGSIASIANNLLGYSNANDSSMNITFICTGTREEAEAIMAIARASAAGTDRGPNMCKIYDAVLVSAQEYDITQEPSGFTFVYGYNYCDAFYKGEHTMSGNEQVVLNSYFDTIEIGDVCTRTECQKVVVARTIDAIFIDYGYSATEGDINGTFAMSQFYGINQEALEAYKAATGKTFEYGLVAAADSDPITNRENGTLDSKKVFVTNADSIALSCFGMRVCGITEEKSDAKIAFCAYIKDGDKLFYLDDGMTVTSVTMKSYNEIMAAIG